MNVRYWVELSQAERGELTAMLSKGKRAARKLKRAQILLAADAGCGDEEIARVAIAFISTRRFWAIGAACHQLVKGRLTIQPWESRLAASAPR
jgi:hypothetical protein